MYLPVIPTVRHADMSEGAGRFSPVTTKLVQDATQLGIDTALEPFQEKEAYALTIGEDGTHIRAITEVGVVRASRTLNQLKRGGAALSGTIVDWPEFEWRGLMIDTVRHFFSLDVLKEIVDLMASLSLNVLHLHVSDDQGWRVEIPALPELTEKSSQSAVNGEGGGYLTVEQYNDLRRYASARGVDVVPEVDMPGHTNAALHAMPGLNPDGQARDVYEGIDVGMSTLSTQAADTERFMDEVIGQLAADSPLGMHIGGDESHSTPHDEFRALVTMAVERVHACGRRAIMWQEAGAMAHEGDIVQLWDTTNNHTEGVLAGIERGARVIVSPGQKSYLDMKENADEPWGQDWAGPLPFRTALEWNPRTALEGLDPRSVIGVEACVWAEYIRTREQLFEKLLPRLTAIAEVAWTGSGDDKWEEFSRRVTSLTELWDAKRLTWHRSEGVDWK